ncbi:MAG: DUF1345 domain-containing protein [Alteraurantiacibacter sp.]
MQLMEPANAALASFDLGALAFTLTCINLWFHGEGKVIRQEAERDDANQLILLVLTGLIGATIMAVLVPLVTQKDALSLGVVTLMVATLALSWLFTNLIFTFHYARLFYGRIKDTGEVEPGSAERGDGSGSDFGGMDFPGDDDPEFSDFVNFAFVIGMTCQTADIAITHPKVRRIATGHGLYAFVFNLGILALTVNVLAGG